MVLYDNQQMLLLSVQKYLNSPRHWPIPSTENVLTVVAKTLHSSRVKYALSLCPCINASR
jgi:ferredoxin-thioredoxin reductase catalytic subunit